MTTPDNPYRRDVVDELAKRLAKPSAIGERAALRRLDLAAPRCPVFWRIAVNDLESVLPPREDDRRDAERRWAVILSGLAEVVGAGLYERKRSLGEAIAAAEVAETRFIRLVRAHGDGLLAVIRPLARQLISKGEQVNWGDVALLVLDDGNDELDEQNRRSLARRYYMTVRKMSAKTQEPTA